jgi:hypothetical protein
MDTAVISLPAVIDQPHLPSTLRAALETAAVLASLPWCGWHCALGDGTARVAERAGDDLAPTWRIHDGQGPPRIPELGEQVDCRGQGGLGFVHYSVQLGYQPGWMALVPSATNPHSPSN